MSRSLRRGAIAALVLAAIVPLSACAAGNTADTLEIKPDNAATSIGNDLRLNNIVVVAPATAAAEYEGPLAVTVNISNTDSVPHSLKSLLVGTTAATFTDDKGGALSEVVIPAGGAVLLGGDGQPSARVTGTKVTVGGNAETSFGFGDAGKVTAPAYVQPAVGYYAGYGPAEEAAKPSAAASPSASASGSPAASASASPGASTSPSAGASASASAGASASTTPLAGRVSGSPSPSAH
ncbi:DUF461 domain-containing protein [Kitasatospora sp. NPDC048365]|uniref:DUF461 domain-containing protein n=1 Tax=Kitasatospora sp. NPDC048365 TaxID=3364050 RepID=UPI00371C09FA